MLLSIDKTWDGESLDESESVALHLEVEEDHLVLSVRAPFHNDPAPPGPPGATDHLWEFEVVEVFLVGRSGSYTEIELSPHGHHLVLQLSAPRVVEARMLPLEYSAQIEGKVWSGRAVISRALLPEEPVRVNAFAIHGRAPGRRYLALTPLPGPTPDFHQPHRFAELCIEGLNKGC
jgi:hypothetical protein